MVEFGKAQDRLDILYARLRTANRDESPSIRRELDQAWEVQHSETAALAHLAKQVVLRRVEIKTALLHQVTEIERQCQKIPGLPQEQLVAEIAELRQRCEQLRSLVQELR